MTSRALRPRWQMLWLTFFFLICQSTEEVQGYPRADQMTKRLFVKRDVLQSTSANGTSATLKPNDHEMQSTTSTLSNGKIIFPTDELVRLTKLRKAPSCEGATFCEKVNQYPKILVDEAIQKNTSLKYLISVDMISSAADITQRIDASDETPLCASTERVVFPQSAENIHNEWRFILNQENFKQGVRVEICNKEDDKCNIIDGFSESYRTFCKQKYISRELLAMGDDGEAIIEMFRFPASCCCQLKSLAFVR